MKRTQFVAFIFFSFAICNLSIGQDVSIPQIPHDSIKYYEQLGDFDNRYRIVKSYEDSLRNRKLFAKYKATDSLYTYFPNNAIDSTRFRHYLKHHAFKYKKYLGDYDSALQYYEMAHQYVVDKDLLDKHGVHIEGEIGNIYARRNDFNKAALFLTSTIPHLRSVQKYDRLSRLYSDIGNVYKWLGDYSLMEEYYQEGIRLSKQANEYRGLQANYAGLADYNINYVSTTDYDHTLILKYLEASQQAILDNPKPDSQGNLRMMNIEEMWSRYSLAIDSIYAALARTLNANRIAKSEYKSLISREIAKSDYRVAKVYWKLGEIKKSETYVDSAFLYLLPESKYGILPTQDQIYDENTFTDLLFLKSNIYKSKYHATNDHTYLDSTLLAINLAFDANDRLERYLTMQDSKLISAEQNKQMVSLALDAYAMYDSAGLPYSSQEVRRIFDRSKSRVLTENQRKSALISQLTDKDKGELVELENQLLEVITNPMNEVSLKEEHRLRAKIDSFKTLGLNRNTTIKYLEDPYLEYVTADSVYYLFTNIGDWSFITIEGKVAIDSLIKKVEIDLHTQSSEGLDSVLTKLYSLLIPVDVDELGKLSIIPDGQLNYFPFDLLMQDNEYLIQRTAVSYQHSVIQVGRATHESEVDNSILCLSPNYIGTQAQNISEVTRGGLSKLNFTESEIRGIAEVFPGAVEQYESMSFEELNHQLKKVKMFHYAGHAIARNDSAYLIQLVDDRQELLLDKQISEMTNQLDLVTLSACETGLGTYQAGEGVRSLATSFLNSGTKAIVYSLWNANDVSTATIMKEFYSQLAKGKEKSDALRIAKLSYLKDATPDSRHPYYWAAFSLAGNDQSIKKTYGRSRYITGIIVLLLLGIYIINQNKNQNK